MNGQLTFIISIICLAAATSALTVGERRPHIRGQGQKLGGPHAQRVAAKRSYPTSEVRGSSRECQAVMVQERRRGATQVRGQGQRPEGVTPHPRSGAAARRSYPTSEVRGGGREEQPHVQGAVAARAQEGREDLVHIHGQEGDSSKVRSSDCTLLDQL